MSDISKRLAELKALCDAAALGPLKVYPNPMRNDGVFVAQDKPNKPYESRGMDGEPRYPAVPEAAWGIGVQIEPDKARYIVAACTAMPAMVAALEEIHAKGHEWGLPFDAVIDSIIERHLGGCNEQS